MPTQTDTQNTAWTPGPWRVEDVAVNGSLAIMAGSATEYRWLATVSEDLEAGIDWTQTQANAHVIAAVPAMVEELLWIRENLHPRALRRAATDAELIAITRATKVLRDAGVIPTAVLEDAP